jgi:signal transduction histidine kinase
VDILDHGKGIPVDKMKNLFKMFYSTQGDGRGLGLTITKDIIERHGGFIDLISNEKDGTLFKLTLPISKT